MAIGPATALRADIEIHDGRIRSIEVRAEPVCTPQIGSRNETLDLTGYLILPGLINAHDHLEFNLFPRLGRGPYLNYREWAADVYHPHESPLREHLAVPKAVRLWWGGLKNLLSGVTTVCHHNPYVADVFENDFPVRVVKQFRWSHSVAFGEDFGMQAAGTDETPYIIHAGEGTDAESAEEIHTLDRLGLLNSRTVIVHGVAADNSELSLLDIRGSGLIWCPTSNLFTLGKTLDHEVVNNFQRAALGSDSALTAQGDLLDEIRFAHRDSRIDPGRLYSMVTEAAARVLRLRDGEGSVRVGARADLIALKDLDRSPAETLMEASFAQVQASLLGGEIKLCSDEIRARCPESSKGGFEPVNVADVRRWVRAPVAWMHAETQKHLGNNFCLAGREVCS
ncbi:MAG: amidohydrolase family protein [Deltaproteobacteria bacterium]